MVKLHRPQTDDRGGAYGENPASSVPLYVGWVVLFIILMPLSGSIAVPIVFLLGGILINMMYSGYVANKAKEADNEITEALFREAEEVYRSICDIRKNAPSGSVLSPPDYTLYLRPYEVDEMMMVDMREVAEYEERRIPIDYRIVQYMRAEGRKILCVGNNEKHIGIGTVVLCNDTWKDELFWLMLLSQSIFVVPWTSKGVQWEIEQMVQFPSEFLLKCVFLMPPDPLQSGRIEQEWNVVRRFMEEVGFKVPEYDTRGCAFQYTESKEKPNINRDFFAPRN